MLTGMNEAEDRGVRVVVVDDSAFFRYELGSRLVRRGWQLVASVASGEEALKVVPVLQPDLVMMDVVMPGMGGMAAVRALRRRWPGLILMMSGQSDKGTAATWDALEAGANDFIPKPHADQTLDAMVRQIVDRYRALAPRGSDGPQPEKGTTLDKEPRTEGFKAIVIGASTGGPQALSFLLETIRLAPRIPVLIVQHMPSGFTRSFAERLADRLGYPVQESPPEGDLVPWDPPPVIVAAGGKHLRVSRQGAWSESGERLHGVIPSVDVTLSDAVSVFGRDLGVVILTGMGEDGAQGSLAVHQRGGTVIAESRETALVWGMPRAVYEAGAADAVWPLGRISLWLRQVIQHGVPLR